MLASIPNERRLNPVRLAAATQPSSLISCVISASLSCIASALLMLVTLADYRDPFHWFLIPTFLFGAVTGKDVIDWLRGKLDTFEPLTVFALLAFFRGFVANLIRLSTGQWLKYVELPPDWRPWVGGIAMISCAGYLVLKYTAELVARMPARRSDHYWSYEGPRFAVVLWCCIVLCLTANFIKLAVTGVFANPLLIFDFRREITGLGHLLIFSEPLPLLITIALIAYWRRNRANPRMLTIALVMMCIFIVTMLVGGLRGSRSNVIWTVFLALSMIHLTIRPISRTPILLAMVLACGFIYVYSFYKHGGIEGFGLALSSTERRQEMESSAAGEGQWYARLVGGGTDEYSLYRIMRSESDFKYALGETYVGGLARLVPSFIWKDRPAGIMKTGTDLLYGAGAWPYRETSLVWGLSSEAMLNFGPIAAVLVMVIPGALIGMHRARVRRYDSRDSRRLLLPIFFFLILVVHGASSRSLPFLIVKNGFFVAACIVLGSHSVPRRAVEPQ